MMLGMAVVGKMRRYAVDVDFKNGTSRTLEENIINNNGRGGNQRRRQQRNQHHHNHGNNNNNNNLTVSEILLGIEERNQRQRQRNVNMMTEQEMIAEATRRSLVEL